MSPRTDRRFKPSEEKTSWSVTDMWDVHHQITRRIFLGQKNTQIANILGVTKEQVSSVRNSPIVQDKLKAMHATANDEVISIQKEIEELAPKALKVMREILENPDAPLGVRFNAAKDALDRSGNAAPQQVNHLHGHFTANDLAIIKNRAKQIAAENGIIDVTPEE
jgi:hypothetical protein